MECLSAYKTCVNFGDPDICSRLAATRCTNVYGSILSWYVAVYTIVVHSTRDKLLILLGDKGSEDKPFCISYQRMESLNAPGTDYSLSCGSNSNLIRVLKGTTSDKGGAPTPSSSTVEFKGTTSGKEVALTPSSSIVEPKGTTSGKGEAPTPSSVVEDSLFDELVSAATKGVETGGIGEL